MQTDTILIDLDGTLIPMEQQAFIDAYFSDLARFLAGYGYRDARALLGALMAWRQGHDPKRWRRDEPRAVLDGVCGGTGRGRARAGARARGLLRRGV